MTTITIDIETLPCADPVLLADVVAKVSPPKTLKKEETIAAWWATEGEAAKAEAIHRTGLDGALGRICCICWAIDDQPATGEIGENEAELIRLFFEACEDAATPMRYDNPVNALTVVGHNVSGFDLRFIWQRAVIHGIKRPRCLPWNAKPWDASMQDTMLMWNPDRDRRISLDRLCKTLGIASSKDSGMDGSMIAQAWVDGRRNEISDYCRADVEATRECYRRMAA